MIKKKMSKKVPEVKKHCYNPSVILIFTRNFVAVVNFYLLAFTSNLIPKLMKYTCYNIEVMLIKTMKGKLLEGPVNNNLLDQWLPNR